MFSWRYSISKGSNHPFKFIFCAINVLKTNKNAVPLGYFVSRGTLSPRGPADPFWACLKSGGEFGIAVFVAWVFLLDDLIRSPNTPYLYALIRWCFSFWQLHFSGFCTNTTLLGMKASHSLTRVARPAAAFGRLSCVPRERWQRSHPRITIPHGTD